MSTLPTPRRRRRAVAIVTAVAGAVVIVVAGAASAAIAVSSLGGPGSTTADADGVTALDVEAAAATVTVAFEDVDAARLDVTGGSGTWTLERDEETLVVRAPNRPFGLVTDLLGMSGGDAVVDLTLPERLRDAGLDLDLDLSAGTLVAAGTFGEVEAEVGAGDLSVSGSARTLDASVSAGDARIQLADVSSADLSVSSGRLDAVLTGRAPDEVEADVSTGDLDVTLPAEAYDVRSDVSIGSFRNLLDTATSSSRTVTVSVAAGEAVLRPGE